MGHVLCRVTTVGNNSNRLIEMKEKRCHALPGRYSKSIPFQPRAAKNIPATVFHKRVISSSRPSTIAIFVDGVEFQRLTPKYFVNHSHITFTFDENIRTLNIQGIKPTGIIDQLLRIRPFVA